MFAGQNVYRTCTYSSTYFFKLILSNNYYKLILRIHSLIENIIYELNNI